jgi:CsoR family transcriptional regulator, copper-sensing transcriptional repressor
MENQKQIQKSIRQPPKQKAPKFIKGSTGAIPPEQVQALLSRLRRAEGQVRAVVRLIEEGQSCDSVAQQLTAARKALDMAFYALVGCAVEHGQVAPDSVSGLLAKYA